MKYSVCVKVKNELCALQFGYTSHHFNLWRRLIRHDNPDYFVPAVTSHSNIKSGSLFDNKDDAELLAQFAYLMFKLEVEIVEVDDV